MKISNFKQLVTNINDIIIRADPIGIYDSDAGNTDEYDMEVRAIIQNLPKCKNKQDLLEIIWQVFVRFFGSETAGTKDKYIIITEKVWDYLKY